jgi:MFS family permease
MVVVAVPFQIYVLTHSSLAVGLLGLVQIVPIILAGLYGGTLADRFDRRVVQLISKTIVALGSLVLLAGAIVGRPTVGFLYLVAALAAAASAVDQVAWTATIPRLVSRRLLPSALSLRQATYQTAAIIGPAAAGVVIATGGVRWAYAIDATLYVPAAALLWKLSPQPSLDSQKVALGWRAPAEAISFVRRHRLLIGLFSADLVAMIFGMPTAVFPALALTVFGLGPSGLGLLYAAPAAGALLGSLFSGWIRDVSRQGVAVLCAIVVWGLAIAGFGLAGGKLWIGLPLLVLAGGADLVSAIFRGTILQLAIPDSMRGRMTAFHSMVTTAGPRLGDLEAGAVAALVNPVFSVVSGGIACVIGTLALAVLLPELRHYRAFGREVAPPVPGAS